MSRHLRPEDFQHQQGSMPSRGTVARFRERRSTVSDGQDVNNSCEDFVQSTLCY